MINFLNENQPNNEEENINTPPQTDTQETVAEEPNETVTEEPKETVADETPQPEDFPPMGNLQYNPVTFTDIIPEPDKKSSVKGLKVFTLVLVCIIA